MAFEEPNGLAVADFNGDITVTNTLTLSNGFQNEVLLLVGDGAGSFAFERLQGSAHVRALRMRDDGAGQERASTRTT